MYAMGYKFYLPFGGMFGFRDINFLFNQAIKDIWTFKTCIVFANSEIWRFVEMNILTLHQSFWVLLHGLPSFLFFLFWPHLDAELYSGPLYSMFIYVYWIEIIHGDNKLYFFLFFELNKEKDICFLITWYYECLQLLD